MNKKSKNKILVIGDTHFKDGLSYADYILDRREGEKKEILDFIVESSGECGSVVLMGDCFDSKNPTANTVKEFVSFIESFGEKDVYIISGNHSKKGDGTTALDFLKEVKNKKNWHVMTQPTDIVKIGSLEVGFLPYMLNMQLGVETSEEGSKVIMKALLGGDILFAHHAISSTSIKGIKTDLLHEIVLPKDELEKKYKLVVAGHIHEPQQNGRTLITGSVFTSEVGETEKFIYTINEDLEIETLKIPSRGIYKVVDPADSTLKKIPDKSIVKAIVTDKAADLEKLQFSLKRFDAALLIEDYPDERKKMSVEQGAMDFSVEALLKLYADARDVDHAKLLHGLHLISE